MKQLFRNSLLLVGASSAAAVAAAQLLAAPVVAIFAPPGGEVHDYAVDGYRLYSLCFLFMGFNIFASALFTALSNGKISALLSFMRFLLIAVGILFLPLVVGVDGIWLATPVAEVAAFALSLVFVYRYRRVYQYA